MAYVKKGIQKAISLLYINNPPSNVLSLPVVHDLISNFYLLQQHNETKAILLCGNRNVFSSCADVATNSNFNLGESTEEALSNFVTQLENSPKPVVALLEKYAYGGGLELALGCHFRLATPNTKLGLPEVNSGLLPGAQGTQRLPRLVPLILALDMITKGQLLDAQEALHCGLVDKVVNNVDDALTFVNNILDVDLSNRRISQRRLVRDQEHQQQMQDYRKSLVKTSKGLDAPLLGFKAVERAYNEETSFSEGLQYENELFYQAMNSGQSRSLEYVFRAERKASRMPSEWQSLVPRPIRRVAVFGAGGTMGSRIVTTLMAHNRHLQLLMIEKHNGATYNCVQDVRKLIQQARSKSSTFQQSNGIVLMPKEVDIDNWIELMNNPEELNNNPPTNGLLCAAPFVLPGETFQQQVERFIPLLNNVDLIIETVYEDRELKSNILKFLDSATLPSAIIASNTSIIDIDDIIATTNELKHTERICAMHFFNPAHILRLVEVIQTASTSSLVLITVHDFLRRINKIPVVVRSQPGVGFCANRMLLVYLHEALLMLIEGYPLKDIEETLEDFFGMTIGPFKVMDLIGFDILQDILEEVSRRECKNEGEDCEWKYFRHAVNQMLACGRVGRKTGHGWFQYSEIGSSRAQLDEEFVSQFLKQCEFSISNQIEGKNLNTIHSDVVDRCILSVANVGFRMLSEGVVLHEETIDTVWINAFGWPKSRGGPLYYARQLGLHTVLKRVEDNNSRCQRTLSHWQPAPLLVQLAGKNVNTA